MRCPFCGTCFPPDEIMYEMHLRVVHGVLTLEKGEDGEYGYSRYEPEERTESRGMVARIISFPPRQIEGGGEGLQGLDRVAEDETNPQDDPEKSGD